MLSKAKIKQVHALELKKHRDEQQAFVAEGSKTVVDLLGAFACEWIAAEPEWFEAHDACSSRHLTSWPSSVATTKISTPPTPHVSG